MGFFNRDQLQDIFRKEAAPKRQVFVVHSGMSDPENEAATNFKTHLKMQGVKEQDIAVMPAVYPLRGVTPEQQKVLDAQFAGKDLKDPEVKKAYQDVKAEIYKNAHNENGRIMRDSSDPKSEVSEKAFAAYEAALKAHGVKKEDHVVWIGHSAGGQMGLTIAQKAGKDSPYAVDTLVTMGSPIIENKAPQETRVFHYGADGDNVWDFCETPGSSSIMSINKPLAKASPNLDGNDMVRDMKMVKGHSDWYQSGDSIGQVIQDLALTETQLQVAPKTVDASQGKVTKPSLIARLRTQFESEE